MSTLRISAEALVDDKENAPFNKTASPKRKTPQKERKQCTAKKQIAIKEPDPTQMLDEDVNQYNKRMENMLTAFKNESVSDFISFKKQVLSDQASKIELEKSKCDQIINQKHKELLTIREENETIKAKNNTLESMNEAISMQVMKMYESKELMKVRAACFGKWLYKTRVIQSNKKILSKMQKMNSEQLKRNTFVEWKKSYIDDKKKKTMETLNKQHIEQSQKLNSEYAHEIQSLRDQLKEAKIQIEAEQSAKQQIQKNLKQAFMRGICAMNYEASNIINPSDEMDAPVEEEKAYMAPTETMNALPTESKDNKWLPAPVIGAEIPRTIIPQPLKPICKIVQNTGIDGRSEKLRECEKEEGIGLT